MTVQRKFKSNFLTVTSLRMSYWFHRNKLKGTIDQKFDGKGTALKSSATKMLTDMRTARQNLLTLFTDEVAKPENILEKVRSLV